MNAVASTPQGNEVSEVALKDFKAASKYVVVALDKKGDMAFAALEK